MTIALIVLGIVACIIGLHEWRMRLEAEAALESLLRLAMDYEIRVYDYTPERTD